MTDEPFGLASTIGTGQSEQPHLEVGSHGWTWHGQGGTVLVEFTRPTESGPGPDFGSCDCCERLPAGTTAAVLALLDDDHPAAVMLREADIR